MQSKPTKVKAKNIDTAERLFNALDTDSRKFILKQDLAQALLDRGILLEDVRIRQTAQVLKKIGEKEKINLATFRELVQPHVTLIEKALTGNLVIPDFKNFASFITNLYNRTMQNDHGKVSAHIPELADVAPGKYALSVCTVDGQRFNIGDWKETYLARATAEALNYCLAFDDLDEQGIHEKVGRAPKEEGFDYLMLNSKGLPHNPLTGSGALMVGSMVAPSAKSSIRFEKVKALWRAMAGGAAPGWSKDAYESEKRVADADRALAYFMQQKGLFQKGSNVNKHLEFLWQCSAIETTTEAQAVVAATLANAGVCPVSEQEVFKPAVAKHCLSIMAMAGMNDDSSEFAFSVGLPAVSGESGVTLLVVPDVMGIAIYSPRVNANGNSIRGLDFSKKFAERFNFHVFDSAIKNVGKVDPRLKKNETKMKGVMAVTSAASIGDLDELQRLYSTGVDLNEGEYDKRTGIHLAASEGHLEAVKFFVEKGVAVNPKDRWGGTPLADAEREGHRAVLEYLKKHGGSKKA